MFDLFRRQKSRDDWFRFGRQADGSPAEPWGWKIWSDVAELGNT
jgi:hypothetical protein